MTTEMAEINKTYVLHRNGLVDSIYDDIICYEPSSITTNGVWQGEKPLNFSLPLFILQLMIIVVTTQVVVIILKPLRQPRVVAEIMSGVLLRSGFGYYDWFGENIFPLKSLMILETMANIGVLYYMFMVGLEMDVSMVMKHSTRQNLAMVVFGLVLPIILFFSMDYLVENYYVQKVELMNILFLSTVASFTAFPVLTRVLVELKLFNTELGRMAMSTAIVLDLCGWFLVAINLSWLESKNTPEKLYVPIFGSIGFILLCTLVIRPAIMWIINSTPVDESFNELYICLILTGVMICGFITDSIGTHFVFGGFIFGLVVPNGQLGTTLLEKIDDFVTTLLLPLYFTLSGMKTDVTIIFFPDIDGEFYSYWLSIIFLITNVIKMLGIFLVSLYFDMKMHDALSLGLVMNTKGVIEVIALNLTISKWLSGGISPLWYAAATSSIVLVTAIATPAISLLYKANKQSSFYKHITIQKANMDEELKILMCVYTLQNVPGMIDLLKASHATWISPIHVYALHLVELTNRASSMLIIHNATKTGYKHNAANSRTQILSEHIVKSFENYTQHATNIILEPLTIISPYATMHEDICSIVKDEHITFIVVPFHKQQAVDGSMESINPNLCQVNQNILSNAPCTIGILIDRDACRFDSHDLYHIVVIFIGGPDNREALAYGWRMAQQPSVNLTVMRFSPGNNIVESTMKNPHHDENDFKVTVDLEKELQLDNEYIGEFRLKTTGHEAIVFKDNVVNNAEEIVTIISNMKTTHNLYIVGRGQGLESSLVAGLSDFMESPELGPIGDLLASSNFATTASVLVMQQYVGEST